MCDLYVLGWAQLHTVWFLGVAIDSLLLFFVLVFVVGVAVFHLVWSVVVPVCCRVAGMALLGPFGAQPGWLF
ncbi:hypothetical protein [Paraburkholderia steynii]|uniref:hypothetical protein n=1 Tax=Paraburkholderia steynii TaxID=1245441 RepID=UPI000B857E11|nr:hypothetical protein [Paraburkholderia steynii]